MADELFDALLAETKQLFQAKYGEEPKLIVAAPGRVNLIGEHTDYNGGFVFPMGIERYTIIAASPTCAEKAVIWTKNCGSSLVPRVGGEFAVRGEIVMGEHDRVGWESYVQGTIACALERGAKIDGAFNAFINSNVPLGGGLSSSASLEVAVATLMEALSGHEFGLSEKPLLCQKAEHVFARMACGIMDQFISARAEKDYAMLLDCRSQTFEMVPMDDPAVSVLIVNSNVKHQLSGSEYPERRSSCERAAKLLGYEFLREVTLDELFKNKDKLLAEKDGERLFKRAFHAIGEDVRTLKMKDALIAKDWKTVGEQMYASHASLRDDYEVSCPEIDALVNIAKSIGYDGGVIGSRITGGGFGGCTVSLVKTEKADEIAKKIADEYEKQVGKKATIFVTRPAQGARVL